jgi:hypothetical protein
MSLPSVLAWILYLIPTRHQSPIQVKQWSEHDSKKPKDQTREDRKLHGPEQKMSNLAVQGASSKPRRNYRQGPTCSWGNTLEHLGSNTKRRRPRAQAGQPSPLRGPLAPPPFDLASIRAIYSPEARHHAWTHSSSTTMKQRREGHHLGEERVELVD